MLIPLVVSAAFLLLLFMAWVKLRVAKRHSQNYDFKLDPKILADIRKSTGPSNLTTEEALERFKKKKQTEEDAKIKATFGKNIFDEIDARRKGKGKRKNRTFDTDMFHDPVSRMYHELKKEVNPKGQREKEKLLAASVAFSSVKKEFKSGDAGKRQCRRDM